MVFVEDGDPFVYISGGGEFQKMGKPFENSVCISLGKTGIVRGADAEVLQKLIKKTFSKIITVKFRGKEWGGSKLSYFGRIFMTRNYHE